MSAPTLPARFARNKLCRAVEKNKRKDEKATVVELIEILGILRTNVREYIRYYYPIKRRLLKIIPYYKYYKFYYKFLQQMFPAQE